MSKPPNRMRAAPPGEIQREEYLAPLELSVDALSLALGVPATRLAGRLRPEDAAEPRRDRREGHAKVCIRVSSMMRLRSDAVGTALAS